MPPWRPTGGWWPKNYSSGKPSGNAYSTAWRRLKAPSPMLSSGSRKGLGGKRAKVPRLQRMWRMAETGDPNKRQMRRLILRLRGDRRGASISIAEAGLSLATLRQLPHSQGADSGSPARRPYWPPEPLLAVGRNSRQNRMGGLVDRCKVRGQENRVPT